MDSLSILICTTPSRQMYFDRIMAELHRQRAECYRHIPFKIEILSDISDNTVGFKRNALLKASTGEYVCFIDDDDMVASDYIMSLIEALKSKPDCVSLRGVITTDGHTPELFEHSIKYTAWATTGNPIKYERYPNHLNCIKRSIAMQVKFPDINFGEDHLWSDQLHQAGLIKTEVYIDKVLYHYEYRTNKA